MKTVNKPIVHRISSSIHKNTRTYFITELKPYDPLKGDPSVYSALIELDTVIILPKIII